MGTLAGLLVFGFPILVVAISIAVIVKKKKWPRTFARNRDYNLINPEENALH
jgi:hypothetical protein